MTPAATPTAQDLQNKVRAIRRRRTARIAKRSTARERRALYLLNAGKVEQFAVEFPRGVV